MPSLKCANVLFMHRNCVCLRLPLLPAPIVYALSTPVSSVKWRSIHSGAKCTAFIHFMPTFIVSKSFSASYQFASEPKTPVPLPAGPPGSGAGNKRVSIVSVRLSLIMKTAATLSLENAFAITIARVATHLAPCWNVTLLSMRLHLFSRHSRCWCCLLS